MPNLSFIIFVPSLVCMIYTSLSLRGSVNLLYLFYKPWADTSRMDNSQPGSLLSESVQVLCRIDPASLRISQPIQNLHPTQYKVLYFNTTIETCTQRNFKPVMYSSKIPIINTCDEADCREFLDPLFFSIFFSLLSSSLSLLSCFHCYRFFIAVICAVSLLHTKPLICNNRSIQKAQHIRLCTNLKI